MIDAGPATSDGRWGRLGTSLRRTYFGLAPSTGSTLPVLDGVRALAVLAILARHSWGLTGSAEVMLPIPGGGDVDLSPLIVMLSNGVDLFFVLSGFLLARGFIEADFRDRPRPDLRRYVRSRAFRILPAYWLVLAALLVFFVPTVVQPELVYSEAGFRSIVSHALLLQTVFPWSYGLWSPASPFWTLTIELIFYATVPWLARAFFRDRWRLALPASAAVTFGWLWFARSGLAEPLATVIVDQGGRAGASEGFARFFLSKQFPAHLFDFAVGITVANFWVRAKLGKSNLPVRVLTSRVGASGVLLGGVAIVLVSMRELGRLTLTHTYFDGLELIGSTSRSALAFYYFEEPTMAVGFGLIVAALVLGPDVLRRPLSVWPLRLIGILGYSIYLWHMPFLYMHTSLPWLPASPGWRWLAMLGFSGTIILGLSLLTFAFVERPFIQMGRRSPEVPEPQASSRPADARPEEVPAPPVEPAAV